MSSHIESSLNAPTPDPVPVTTTTGSDGKAGPFSPLSWSEFFETNRKVSIPSELDSSNISFNIYEINSDKKGDLPVIVLHHGAGHCALSFAATARALHRILGDQVRIMSYDARGHGETTSDDQNNLHIDRLARDLHNIILTLYGQQGKKESSLPTFFLVGHSMGGAVVTEVATRGLLPNVARFAVLDIQETNKEIALLYVRKWCESRPVTCDSVEQAIQWGVESGTVHNVDSARISFTGMVGRIPGSPPKYTWYTDLMLSEAHWHTWFENLNRKFLSAKPPKILILQGRNAMDDEMKAAYEQGNFQLSFFENSGHAVQEDEPDRMGKELAAFWEEK
ncbi:Protein phosphatase methylesterase 1 [Lobosporangium transversale]|uniref:Protein phosphatase methylesterase 1 n=1 Tax=Lobosporangium transversale TaxID=64571 RepID=A0A1Y2GLZ6_9FUNG|nr:Alpha/Beta hydrolase protein [Lobosporangium transversale]KAF9915642.1 Protein phosphatase methylesterase 1 [Lobosporangium transversale]ORZ13441.1 Alpha/Beta hydrolase protein [Lobosporangium transversale]|eukprot:XP_021880522.1 Alpha/Beta hydrolase protein [Lobosporangium transversale]